MFLKILGVLSALGFAFLVLIISLFRLSSPNYAFYQTPKPESYSGFTTDVGYFFPHPGMIPDSPLWPFKALRDKVWLVGTFDKEKRVKLLLLFADKRVIMAEELIKKRESELAVSTAERAEQYLNEAYIEVEKGIEKTDLDLCELLAKASLRHRESMEYTISLSPEDAVPLLTKTLNIPKEVYEKCSQKLVQNGRLVPQVLQKKD